MKVFHKCAHAVSEERHKMEKQERDLHANRPPRIACVGGFGHAVDVFDDFHSLGGSAGILLGALCPAWEGEDLDWVAGHPWVEASQPRRYECLDALLLIVSTRPDWIADAIERGLRAGCHVVTEKPLALDCARLDELEVLAVERARSVQAMLSMRRWKAFAVARDWVRQGLVGEVLLLDTRKSYKWGRRPRWFNDRGAYGGTWPWIGIHNLDMAHYLTGRHAVWVAAQHGNGHHPDFPGCEDVASGVFRLEGGLQMTASIDLCREEAAATHGDDWCRVVGAAGTIEISASRGRLALHRDGREQLEAPGTEPIPIYRDWLGSVCTDSPLPPDNTAFRLTRSALVARHSADSGEASSIGPAVAGRKAGAA